VAVITGTVDTSTVGVYVITYTATDAAGNVADANRTVNVVEVPVVDTEAPVVVVNGDANVTLFVDGNYTELNATVTDNVDTNLTAVITGTVDTSTVGVYVITYTATDAAGNVADANRTVNVVEVPVVDTEIPITLVIEALRTNLTPVVEDDLGYTFALMTDYVLDTESAGSDTFAVHGKIDSSDDPVVLRPDARYPATSKFQVVVKNANGEVVGQSAVFVKADPLNWGVITLGDPHVTIEAKIVERHNVYRNLEFSDSNLTWDTTLAKHAQQWANYLAVHYTQTEADAGQSPHAAHFNEDTHGLPFNGEGENIARSSLSSPAGYVTSSPVDIMVENFVHDQYVGGGEGGAVDSWSNEKAFYDYENNTGNGDVVGHYTQVAWQKTTKVGCAKADSISNYRDSSGHPVEWVVCRYEVPGNRGTEKPYCGDYSFGAFYNDDSLVFTTALIEDATMNIIKELEDRTACTNTEVSDGALVFTGTTSAMIDPNFDAFNLNDSNNRWPMNFDDISIVNGELIMVTDDADDDNDRYMKLKLIGQDGSYYFVEANWMLQSNPGYARSAILKLEK